MCSSAIPTAGTTAAGSSAARRLDCCLSIWFISQKPCAGVMSARACSHLLRRRRSGVVVEQGYSIPSTSKRLVFTNALVGASIEHFNNTLRQRVSRLVREALSFSKKLANHIGAIKLFICHY